MESNQMTMRDALEEAKRFILDVQGFLHGMETTFPGETEIIQKINTALSAPPHKGRWENGTTYEYEYAYCSECGHMQWAGWDSHREAEDNIEEFAHNYKFCPGCGAKMDGGIYVK